MLDLLGDPLQGNRPNSTGPAHILNTAFGFLEFWSAWPPGPRKVAKQQCLDKWAKLGCADHAEHIRLHVEWMKTQDDWKRGFVPLVLTYLNQTRWQEWTPVAAVERPLVDPALAKIREDDKKAAPLSDEMRRKLAELRGKR